MGLQVSKVLPMAALIIGIWIIGIALGYIDALNLGPLSAALFAIAIVGFLGSLRAGADMRTAITIGFVVVYFAVFAALATSSRNQTDFDTAVGLEIWQNFTYLVGVIVVSYFGVTAATEITQIVKGSSGSDSTTTNADTNTQ